MEGARRGMALGGRAGEERKVVSGGEEWMRV
jgi:hypothetical protein